MMWRTVNDVMTKAVVSAYRDASFDEIVRVMIERGITAVPVIDEDHHVVGVVSESDLLSAQGGKRHWPDRPGDRPPRTPTDAMNAGGLMSTPAITAHPDTTITQAARLLDQHRIKRLPVVDDENRLIGIVSLRDLLRVFTRTDEDIRDEILHEIFARLLPADLAAVSVRVSHGVVTLGGTLRHRILIPIAVRLVAGTDGVIGVIDELTYTNDDTTEAARPSPRG
jgi:CBS domain-containing protein